MSSENTVGVIVARVQVSELHDGHRALIDYVRARHSHVLIVLGSTGGSPTPENPLPYEVRETMVREAYPDVYVAKLVDHPISPAFWSRDLDALIGSMFPSFGAVLYGSRKSFLEYYLGSGKYTTEYVPPVSTTSGTELRSAVAPPTTKEGREALIWETKTRHPRTYRAADIAIVRPKDRAVLLIGKKKHEGYLSFPGGHVDPGESDETAARRERTEEVPGISTGGYTYLGSFPVADPRYRGSKDGMTTALFLTWYNDGTPSAGDDADSVEWVSREQLIERLVPWHRPLGERLLGEIR